MENPLASVNDFPPLPATSLTVACNVTPQNANLASPSLKLVLIANSSWSSLFKASRSDNSAALKKVNVNIVDGVATIPSELINKGINEWSNYVVGFFFGRRLPYPLVQDFVQKNWKLKGGYSISTDKDLFYFKFSLVEDMRQFLEADPIYITGKLFVIRQWTPEVEAQKSSIKTLPVWVKLMNLPKQLWTDDGLDYVASLIGNPMCMDQATKLRQRLNFAKFCVEVRLIMSTRKVRIKMNEKEMDIDLEYPWIPLPAQLAKIWAQSGRVVHQTLKLYG
ncbi:hypothetical protein IFM89_036528 [Coptis chinensis]|uniref:DUF4283 domain-containing protein n=1 Tax=Coptis chinensis TaxID=261450 RepID=A0A835HAS8_9MAGN|nr:hypothetical protein IFM89_036528 [Coptis chinensis]